MADAAGGAVALWDTHLHIIGDRARFPLSPDRGYEPPNAPLEALLAHLDCLGATKGVIVQPSVYGFDNACLLDALERSGQRCRGVAVPPPDVARSALEAMHAAGVRGVRCNLVNPSGLGFDSTRPWWPWMVARDWHIVLQIDATQQDLEAIAGPGRPPVVVDHMGYPPPGSAPASIATLVDAVRRGDLYVKLSAPYRISAEAAPYRDAQHLAQTLLSANPARCLFATDWPHTETSETPMPDAEWLVTVRSLAGTAWPLLAAAASALYGR